jgi:hypothetical protein
MLYVHKSFVNKQISPVSHPVENSSADRSAEPKTVLSGPEIAFWLG